MKRLIIIGLILSLFTGSKVKADISQQNLAGMNSSRLLEIEKVVNSTGDGLFNAIDSLSYVYEYSLRVSFLLGDSIDDVSDMEKDFYAEQYINFIKMYNNKYGKYLAMPEPKSGNENFMPTAREIVFTKIPNFILMKLEDIDFQYNSKTENTEKTKYLNSQNVTLNRLARVIDNYSSLLEDVTRLSESERLYKFDYKNVNYDNEKLLSIFDASDKYAVLLERGRSLATVIGSQGDIYIDTSKPALENLMANQNLSLSYLAILASSSMYTPFVSYTGSADFMRALIALAPDTELENLTALYGNTKNIVKPLYKRDIDSVGSPTGIATLLTLKDFIEDVKKGGQGALVTILGDFSYDSATQNWMYKVGENVTYAYDTVTDQTVMSSPILMYSNQYLRSIDNLTYSILNNLLNNTGNINKLKDIGDRYLFVNMYGDIVTDNNLVIVPGATNPLIYSDSTGYTPYTVGFMNYYPVIESGSAFLNLVSKNDIGSFIMMGTEEDKLNNISRLYRVTSRNTVDTTYYLQAPNFSTAFFVNNEEVSPMISDLSIQFEEDESKWTADHPLWNHRVFSMRQTNTINNTGIFPYLIGNDITMEVAKVIADNMYNFYTWDVIGSVNINKGLLNDGYISSFLLYNVSTGTNNPVGYTKDKKFDYDKHNNDLPVRIGRVVEDFVSNIVEVFGASENTLGLGNFYSNPVYGKVFVFIKSEIYLILFISLIVLVWSFLRKFRGMVDSVVISGAVLLSFYLLLCIVPYYIPTLSNFLLSNFAEDVAYVSLMLNTEDYASNQSNANLMQLDEYGNFKYNTNSITLYKSSIFELDSFYSGLAVQEDEVTGGRIHVLNQKSGLFVENNSIKINTDILLDSLKIKSDLVHTDTGLVYQFYTEKTVSNNVDYYSPYYAVVDAFVEKLNTNIRLFNIPRKLINYSTGVSKDNYAVFSYINSPQFLRPEIFYLAMLEDISPDVVGEETYAYYQTMEESLRAEYGNNIDFLGIQTVLIDEIDKYRATSWYRVMQREGYYDMGGSPDLELLSELIDYVNYYSRKFIFDNLEALSVMSDETAIEIICLNAITRISDEASSPKNYMYPSILSFEDIILEDVLRVVLIGDHSKYKELGYDIVSYVKDNFGTLNVVVLALIFILYFIISNAISFLIPLVYLALPVILLIKFLAQGKLEEPIKGYLETTVRLSLVATLFTVGISIISKVSNKLLALYMLLLLGSTVLSLIVSILKCIIKDPVNLGSGSFKVKLSNIISAQSPSGKKLELPVKSARYRVPRTRVNRKVPNTYDKYRIGKTVNDRYSAKDMYTIDDYDPDYELTREIDELPEYDDSEI